MTGKTYPNTIIQSLIFLFIPILFLAPIILIQKIFEISEFILGSIFVIVYFIAILFFYHIKNKRQIRFSFKINDSIIPISLFIILLQIGITQPLLLLFKNPETSFNNDTNLFYILVFVIIHAITEEVIFRGIILKGYLESYSPQKAIFFSALLFAAIHLDILQACMAFIIGLITGYIFYITRSVGFAIVIHCVHNIIAVLADIYYEQIKNNEGINIKYIIALGLILFISSIFHLLKNRDTLNRKLREIDIKN